MKHIKRNRSPRLLELIHEPHPKLHLQSLEVDVVNDEIRELMDDMLFTMYNNNGIGLAAVQVGILKKVVVIDVSERDIEGSDLNPMFLVNAKITKFSENKSSFHEGCLSLPGIYADVIRPSDIIIEYLDYYGVKRKLELNHSLLSVCIQHEIDHTNGIVFTDHLSKMKRDFLINKMLKSRKKSLGVKL